MPEITIWLVAGRSSADEKRALVREVTDAMVRTIGAVRENIGISIVETPLENRAKGGVLFSDRE